jgi:hypothetical protein
MLLCLYWYDEELGVWEYLGLSSMTSAANPQRGYLELHSKSQHLALTTMYRPVGRSYLVVYAYLIGPTASALISYGEGARRLPEDRAM